MSSLSRPLRTSTMTVHVWSRLAQAITLFVPLAIAACGSDSAPSSQLPDPSIPLNSTTASDRRALCDWSAALFGGYGQSETCPQLGERLTAAADQQTCATAMEAHIVATPGCPETVGQFQACLQAVTSNLCVALESNVPACDPGADPVCTPRTGGRAVPESGELRGVSDAFVSKSRI